jgi:hypothetical protein
LNTLSVRASAQQVSRRVRESKLHETPMRHNLRRRLGPSGHPEREALYVLMQAQDRRLQTIPRWPRPPVETVRTYRPRAVDDAPCAMIAKVR